MQIRERFRLAGITHSEHQRHHGFKENNDAHERDKGHSGQHYPTLNFIHFSSLRFTEEKSIGNQEPTHKEYQREQREPQKEQREAHYHDYRAEVTENRRLEAVIGLLNHPDTPCQGKNTDKKR